MVDSPERLVEAFESGDQLARALLLSTIALVLDPATDALLLDALEGSEPAEREHAAWALADRPAMPEAVPALRAMHAAGGFAGMLAELTLEGWYPAPARREASIRIPARRAGGRGLRIVQIFMQGWVDSGLSRAGAGDGGGLATLLVHLSAALSARREVDHVTTLTRGFAGPGVPAVHGVRSEPVSERATIERVWFGGDGYLPSTEMWAHRRELEHALERALRRLAPVDAVHLRFADVATLAATRVCERLGLPVYFTLAPDPHALIRSRERSGALDRRSFVAADRAEHLLFRARLVERMRDRAAGLALLPRGGAREELRDLVRLPVDGGGRRIRVVPEGISIGAVDAAAHRLERPSGPGADLVAEVRRLPERRRGLPLILSVGRLHRVKGFATLFEAWAGDPTLRAGFNLAIVGGDLERPTAEERLVLRALMDAADRYPGAADGLLLLGHRPHREVIGLMAAARAGVAGAVGHGGVYACASEKEEFGLALLEAMASGLSVVGPALGGPPTYIEDGVNGAIANTATVHGVRAGLRRAAAARLDADRIERASRTVRERFTIDAMAAGLVDLYSIPSAVAVAS